MTQDLAGQFDRGMISFIDHLKMVLQAREATRIVKINRAGPNPIAKYLNKYAQVYDKTSKTDPLEHLPYFTPIARRYLDKIASGDDAWLLNNSVIVQYGAGTKAESRTREIKIMISSIYQVACTLRDEKEAQLEGQPDEEWSKAHELNYPDILLLDLYRILVLSAPEIDKPKIRTQIERLEQDLGLSQGGSTTMNQGSLNAGALIGMASQFAGKLGINLPPGGLPNEREIGSLIDTFIGNDKTKNVIGQMFNEIQECKTPGDLVNGLVKTLNDPNLAEALTNTATETMRSAGMTLPGAVAEPTTANIVVTTGGPADPPVGDETVPSVPVGTLIPVEDVEVVQYCDEAVCLV